MHNNADPDLVESLRGIFATRTDVHAIVEYEKQLYNAIQALHQNHRAIHEHVSHLTTAHNTVREDTNVLFSHRDELRNALNQLTEAHRQTRHEISTYMDALTRIQEKLDSIVGLQARIEQLERAINR